MIVRYTRQALNDLESLRNYISQEQPRAAAAMAGLIREAVDGLSRFPERGRPGRVAGTRELVIPGTPFVVPYRVAGQEVQILAVLHGARAWPPR